MMINHWPSYCVNWNKLPLSSLDYLCFRKLIHLLSIIRRTSSEDVWPRVKMIAMTIRVCKGDDHSKEKEEKVSKREWKIRTFITIEWITFSSWFFSSFSCDSGKGILLVNKYDDEYLNVCPSIMYVRIVGKWRGRRGRMWVAHWNIQRVLLLLLLFHLSSKDALIETSRGLDDIIIYCLNITTATWLDWMNLVVVS